MKLWLAQVRRLDTKVPAFRSTDSLAVSPNTPEQIFAKIAVWLVARRLKSKVQEKDACGQAAFSGDLNNSASHCSSRACDNTS